MNLPSGVKLGRTIQLDESTATRLAGLKEIWDSARDRFDDLQNRMVQAETIFKGTIYQLFWEQDWQSKGVLMFDEDGKRIVELLPDQGPSTI